MKQIKWFLEWLLVPRGSMGVYQSANGFMMLGKVVSEHDCVVCGKVYWSRAKKPWPTCMRWYCFKEYKNGRC